MRVESKSESNWSVRLMPVREIHMHSPAKVNLFLEVLGKRDDGYHELETLMVRSNLCDLLHFKHKPTSDIRLQLADRCHVEQMGRVPPRALKSDRFPLDDSNLIVRAARRLRQWTGTDQGASIVVRKRIPVQAGLGGGSGNAAVTLIALNRLWNLNLPLDELHEMAGELGSDLNFLLSGFRLALCRGRGDDVLSIPLAQQLHAVIVVPEEGNSTADVFRRLSLNPDRKSSDALQRGLRDGKLAMIQTGLFNRLEDVAENLNPAMSSALNLLRSASAGTAFMTGSGSACVCVVPTARRARIVAARLAGHSKLLVTPVRLG